MTFWPKERHRHNLDGRAAAMASSIEKSKPVRRGILWSATPHSCYKPCMKVMQRPLLSAALRRQADQWDVYACDAARRTFLTRGQATTTQQLSLYGLCTVYIPKGFANAACALMQAQSFHRSSKPHMSALLMQVQEQPPQSSTFTAVRWSALFPTIDAWSSPCWGLRCHTAHNASGKGCFAWCSQPLGCAGRATCDLLHADRVASVHTASLSGIWRAWRRAELGRHLNAKSRVLFHVKAGCTLSAGP